METNEVLTNEEVVEAVEDVAIDVPNNTTKLIGAAAIAATIGVGVLLVKKFAIPAIKKYKAKKEAEANSADTPIEVDFKSKEENA